MSQRIAQLTDDKFQISVFPGGELVPGTQAFDAVSNSTVECGHTLDGVLCREEPGLCIRLGRRLRRQLAPTGRVALLWRGARGVARGLP